MLMVQVCKHPQDGSRVLQKGSSESAKVPGKSQEEEKGETQRGRWGRGADDGYEDSQVSANRDVVKKYTSMILSVWTK